MSFREITATPSTSLVLIKTVQKPTIVYLSTFAYPDFSLTVRDTTGSQSLATTSSIVLSTVGGALFQDGTYTYRITQPYGLANVSLRTSTVWQLYHTSGQTPSTSAANVSNLSVNTAYFTLHSTVRKTLTDMTVEELLTNSFSITNPLILTNLSSPGLVEVQGQLTVSKDVSINGNLTVSGATLFLSSVSVVGFSTMNWDIRGQSTLTVGGSISTNAIEIGGLLQTRSTIQVQTLEIQRSTLASSVLVELSTLIYGSISSLSSVFVWDTLVGKSDMDFGSYLSTQKTLSTTSLTVQGYTTLENSISTSGAAVFSSFFTVKGAIQIGTTAVSHSTIETVSSLYTYALLASTVSFGQSLSTIGPLWVFSTLTVQGQLSTGYVAFVDTVSSQELFLTLNSGTPSSFLQTQIDGLLSARIAIQAVNLESVGPVGIGRDAEATRLSAFSSLFYSDFVVGSNTIVKGGTDIQGSVSVESTLTVTGNLTVLGAATLSSITEVFVFSLSNLQVRGSTLASSFSTVDLFVSTLDSETVQLTVPTYRASSFYTSSLQVQTVYTDSLQTDSLLANRFIYATSSTPIPDVAVYVEPSLYFENGLSTISTIARTIQSAGFQGGFFQGDARFVENIPFEATHLSGITLAVETLQSFDIFTSSFIGSSFTVKEQLLIQSTLMTPVFRMDSIGIPSDFTQNQFLPLSVSTLAINNTLFLDKGIQRVGINLSSPEYALDISGSIYAQSIEYSSIREVSFGDASYSFDTIYASTVGIQYDLQYQSNGIRLPFFPSSNIYFELREIGDAFSTNQGLYTIPSQSTIAINKSVYIQAGTRRVGIFQTTPSFELEVGGSGRVSSLETSTLYDYWTLRAPTLVFSTLVIFGNSTPTFAVSTNTVLTNRSTLVFNSLLTVNRGFDSLPTKYVGIRTQVPRVNLDILGNAFFSTMETTSLRINGLSLSSELL
jgi:hypothetical protein